jgi:hypothetical protein
MKTTRKQWIAGCGMGLLLGMTLLAQEAPSAATRYSQVPDGAQPTYTELPAAVIRDQKALISLLEKRKADLEKTNASLVAENTKLRDENAKLAQKVADLEKGKP